METLQSQIMKSLPPDDLLLMQYELVKHQDGKFDHIEIVKRQQFYFSSVPYHDGTFHEFHVSMLKVHNLLIEARVEINRQTILTTYKLLHHVMTIMYDYKTNAENPTPDNAELAVYYYNLRNEDDVFMIFLEGEYQSDHQFNKLFSDTKGNEIALVKINSRGEHSHFFKLTHLIQGSITNDENYQIFCHIWNFRP
jgi:hypothetical protein